ncbi:MAG TPA: hypothetical protein VFK49_03730, partial [Stellaceae bacterium]|nr:hypothetical protein [Stellaceae bacterium]
VVPSGSAACAAAIARDRATRAATKRIIMCSPFDPSEHQRAGESEQEACRRRLAHAVVIALVAVRAFADDEPSRLEEP